MAGAPPGLGAFVFAGAGEVGFAGEVFFAGAAVGFAVVAGFGGFTGLVAGFGGFVADVAGLAEAAGFVPGVADAVAARATTAGGGAVGVEVADGLAPRAGGEYFAGAGVGCAGVGCAGERWIVPAGATVAGSIGPRPALGVPGASTRRDSACGPLA